MGRIRGKWKGEKSSIYLFRNFVLVLFELLESSSIYMGTCYGLLFVFEYCFIRVECEITLQVCYMSEMYGIEEIATKCYLKDTNLSNHGSDSKS